MTIHWTSNAATPFASWTIGPIPASDVEQLARRVKALGLRHGLFVEDAAGQEGHHLVVDERSAAEVRVVDPGVWLLDRTGGRRLPGHTDAVLPLRVTRTAWDPSQSGVQIVLHSDMFFPEVAGYLEEDDDLDLPWQRGVRFDNRAVGCANASRFNAWFADVRRLVEEEGLQLILDEPEGQGAWYGSQTSQEEGILDPARGR